MGQKRQGTGNKLKNLKIELEQITNSLRFIQDPPSRLKLVEDFKKGLNELRKSILEN